MRSWLCTAFLLAASAMLGAWWVPAPSPAAQTERTAPAPALVASPVPLSTEGSRLAGWPFPQSATIEAATKLASASSHGFPENVREVHLGVWTARTSGPLGHGRPHGRNRLVLERHGRRVVDKVVPPTEILTGNFTGRGGRVGRLPEDLQGDGIPDLVLNTPGLGNWVCGRLQVVELGETARRVLDLDLWADRCVFYDADGDGCLEIVYGETAGAIRPWKWPPYPLIVLRWDGRGYRMAGDLMRRSAPPSAELDTWADKVRRSAPRRPPESWTDGGIHADFNMALAAAVQNLYYTGNEKAARRFLERSWPEGWPGRGERWRTYRELLDRSPYRDELHQLQGT